MTCSVEESENFSTNCLSLGLLVVHNALVSCKNNITELTRWKNGVGEVFEVAELQVKTRRNDTTLGKAAVQVNNDFSTTGIINNGELTNVTFGLH